MDIKEVFKKYDPKSEAVWKEYKEMKFLIAPMGTSHQKKKITQFFTLKEAMGLELNGALSFENVKANVALGNIYQLYAHCLVLDWKDVQEDGTDMNFTHEKIHEWMMEYDDFANWVISTAQDLQIEQLKAKEELIKN